MASGSGGIASTPAGGSGRVVQPGSTSNPGAIQSPAQGLEMLQSALDHLDSLDRATLATDVLEGNSSDFPGRAKWEERLFAAKQTFVSQTRAILQKATQLTASSESIKDAQDPNDTRVKNLATKLDQLVQQAQENSAAFQAVAAEGKNIAAHPAASY
jgi:small-conductance mechanosensitive channel